MLIRNSVIPGRLSPRVVNGSRRKKQVTRKRHQAGELVQLSHGWSCRYYVEEIVDGLKCRKRMQRFLGDVTLSDAADLMAEFMVHVNKNELTIQPPTKPLTFSQVAKLWIEDRKDRKRKPVKPSVIANWRSILDHHVLPVLGDKPLADVDNAHVHDLVEGLCKKGLSPATVGNIVMVVKLAVAFGRKKHKLPAREWDMEEIDAPIVDERKQHKPIFSDDEVTNICKIATGRLQMAAVLFAASGMRTGELLGLQVQHFDGHAVLIEQQVWRGQVLPPKTPNAHRTIDLHPDVCRLLAQFIGTRTKGFLFQTRGGKPMSQRNLIREFYSVLEVLKIKMAGFHAFRRYRITYLRNARCPYGLLRFWDGHARRDMSDVYDQSHKDIPYRRDVAGSMGLGFVLPETLSSKKVSPVLSGVIGRQAETAETAIAVSH
jgi:integrase